MSHDLVAHARIDLLFEQLAVEIGILYFMTEAASPGSTMEDEIILALQRFKAADAAAIDEAKRPQVYDDSGRSHE